MEKSASGSKAVTNHNRYHVFNRQEEDFVHLNSTSVRLEAKSDLYVGPI